MERTQIISIVNDFLINEIEIDETKLNNDAQLKNDLGIDSLDFVDIVVIVEKHFGFKINADEMVNVITLSQFYDFIESKIGDR